MARTTKAQLDSALEGYVKALKDAGLGHLSDVAMYEGSVSMGVHWKLLVRGPGRTRPVGLDGWCDLGKNRSEAYDTLRTITLALNEFKN